MRKSKRKSRSSKSAKSETTEGFKGDAPDKEKKGSAEEESPEERLSAAEAKAKENYDRFLRVTAEFENYKKRAEREMEDFRKFASESLVKDILPIVDNLERELNNRCEGNEKAFQGIREGVEMTLKGLLETLEKGGVVPIESLGKPFDPNFHQAVMQKESEEHSENTVMQELLKGYMMKDRLLRPAMVVVAKKPHSEAEVESGDLEDEQKEDEQKIEVTIQ